MNENVMKSSMYNVTVVPKRVKSTDEEGKTIHKHVYEQTTKLTEKAKATGAFEPDKFFHLQLSEQSSMKLGGDPTVTTLVVFSRNYPHLFRMIKEEVDSENYTVLSDKSVVLKELLPGKVIEMETPPYYGMDMKPDGSEEVRMVWEKQQSGEYVKKPMVRYSVKFFMFSNEVEGGEKQKAIAYARATSNLRWTEKTAEAASGDEPPSENRTEGEDESPE